VTSTHESKQSTFDAIVDGDDVARSSRHTLLAQLATQVSRLAVNVILARLLTPHDFGVVAAGVVIMVIAWQITDLGTAAVVIQRDVIDDALVCSLFWVNLILGVALSAAMFALAHPLAVLMGQPHAAPAIQALASVCVLGAVGNMHWALMRRTLQFSQLAVINITAAILNGVVGIVLALAGAGLWALVVGMIANTGVVSVGAWWCQKWRPSLRLDVGQLRAVARPSAHYFWTSALAIVFNQLDKVIVSRVLGGGALGTYSLAQRTVTAPVNTVSESVATVSFSVFARDQNDPRALRAGATRVGGVVALVVMPSMIGLAVLAEQAVVVVYGAHWSAAIPVVQVLAPLAALQALSNVPRSVMYARGRSDWLYRWGLAYCLVGAMVMVVSSRWGLIGVSLGLAAVVVLLSPIEMKMALGLIDMRLWTFVRSLLPLAGISAAMGLAAWCAAAGLDRLGRGEGLQLVAGTVVGVVVYAGLMVVTRPPAFDDARRVAGRWAGGSAS
jgi:PST family polysaccharide transporter